MKFSYSLIREMVPNLPAKKKVADELALKSFEVDGIEGDALDIKINSNRWSDAASHTGIAREAAAIFNSRSIPVKVFNLKKIKKGLGVRLNKDSGCYRYMGCKIELAKKGTTPSWMKKYLRVCGLRSISPIVDILNYVMIEVGQPMHAFDAEKVKGDIIVRKAKKGEKIITIDGGEYKLSSSDTVIADEEKLLAIAGIKGGKSAEITAKTKKVILEAANFDSVSVYKTSRDIKLDTDASRRYGHGMSSEKAYLGMGRALKLLEQICFAKPVSITDVYEVKEPRKFIKFDSDKFESITGVKVSKAQAIGILKKLGFKMKGDVAEVPAERLDVEIFEDLAEEVIRMYGLEEIEAEVPVISIVPLHDDPIVHFKDKVKRSFVTVGFDEILSYSFGDFNNSFVELLNPISQDKAYMRPNLATGLDEVIDKNEKSFNRIRIFEFGKVFDDIGKEHWSLAGAVKTDSKEDSLRILRGSLEEVLDKIGIGYTSFISSNKDLLILEVDGKEAGKLWLSKKGSRAFFEADAEKLMEASEAEFEYKPLSPYPTAMRDLSLWVSADIRVGDLLGTINDLNISDLSDVDLEDYYPDLDNNRFGITFRLIFQSYKKTLTEAEIEAKMGQIIQAISALKGVEIR